MILGLAATLPGVLTAGLATNGVLAAAAKVAHLPPVSALFAALLGYDPIRTLLAPAAVLRSLPPRTVAALTAAVLPAPDRRRVPPRPGHGLHRRRGDGADRRAGLLPARPPGR